MLNCIFVLEMDLVVILLLYHYYLDSMLIGLAPLISRLVVFILTIYFRCRRGN
jgi:hypothetical protein